ncbi:DUF3667 domain-containing protein [Hyphomonas sp.]|uniref:DUF3667 domain-containing protein n=1 Tax=Hyphomonas sp. TaxID=87 RepID=UPI0035640E7F
MARTLPDPLIRPGRMTRAYLDGQRARFIPPLRLYVLASLVLFVLLPLVMGQRIAFVPEGAQNFEQARAAIEQSYTDGDLTLRSALTLSWRHAAPPKYHDELTL